MMKKTDLLKILALLFIATLQGSILIWTLSLPEYSYFSLINIQNKFYKRNTEINNKFPDIKIYNQASSYNLLENIKKQLCNFRQLFL